MAEAKVTFSFEGADIWVQCLTTDKMKDICQKYANKIKKDMKTFIFLYGGNLVQFDLNFKEQASIIDRKYNEMKILVYKNEENKKLDEIISSTNSIKARVDTIKLQIRFIVKNCSEKITLQLNNINYLLNGVNDDINKVNDKIINLSNDYTNNGLIKILQSRINEFNRKLNELKNENKLLIDKNNDLQNINNEYKSKIKKLESEKDKKNDKKQLNSFKNSDKIMSVNFVSIGIMDIVHYSLVCKDTDLFVRLEERLYEDFPQFKNYDNYFVVNGKRILRFKTLAENGIENNNIINVFAIDV